MQYFFPEKFLIKSGDHKLILDNVDKEDKYIIQNTVYLTFDNILNGLYQSFNLFKKNIRDKPYQLMKIIDRIEYLLYTGLQILWRRKL